MNILRLVAAAAWVALAAGCGGTSPPKPASASTSMATLDVPPQLEPEPQVAFPEQVMWKLRNGVTVWLVEGHRLPIVSARIVTRISAGEADNGPSVTAVLMSLVAQAIAPTKAARLAFRGANVATSVNWDTASLSVTSESGVFPTVLRTLADDVARPRYTQGTLDAAKKLKLKRIDLPTPTEATHHVAALAMFGRKHPYGETLRGRGKEIERVTLAQMSEAHRRAFRPDEVGVFICGDTRREDIAPILEETLGRLAPASSKPHADWPNAIPDPHRLLLVDMPNATRAQIFVADDLPAVDGDEAILPVLEDILGNPIRGRLDAALRIAHGYTYGAHSAFIERRHGTMLAIAMETSVESAPGAVRSLVGELRRLATEGAGEAEVERAKRGTIWNVYASFETAAQVVDRMDDSFGRKLGFSAHADRVARIRALTKGDIDAAAKRLIRLDRMRIVIAADTHKLQREIDDLGFGEPSFRDLWGEELSHAP